VRTFLGLVLAVVIALAQAPAPGTAAAGPRTDALTTLRRVPSRTVWLRDVRRAMKRHHARRYLDRRAAASHGRRLAVTLDIDNTVRQTYFHRGAIPEMLRFTGFARTRHVVVLFNTARSVSRRRATRRVLHREGFRWNGLCMRRRGERAAHSKLRCRRAFRSHGYVLIEVIGNSRIDLRGRGYERGIKLPSYGGRLR